MPGSSSHLPRGESSLALSANTHSKRTERLYQWPNWFFKCRACSCAKKVCSLKTCPKTLKTKNSLALAFAISGCFVWAKPDGLLNLFQRSFSVLAAPPSTISSVRPWHSRATNRLPWLPVRLFPHLRHTMSIHLFTGFQQDCEVWGYECNIVRLSCIVDVFIFWEATVEVLAMRAMRDATWFCIFKVCNTMTAKVFHLATNSPGHGGNGRDELQEFQPSWANLWRKQLGMPELSLYVPIKERKLCVRRLFEWLVQSIHCPNHHNPIFDGRLRLPSGRGCKFTALWKGKATSKDEG